MLQDRFENYVIKSYENNYKDLLNIAIESQISLSEIEAILASNKINNKSYSKIELLSKAGDILNFLVVLLNRHNLSLAAAMDNNINKLKEKGWL